jgi:transposase
MKQQHSWEVTDAFWEAARPLIPKRERETAREYHRKPGGGCHAMNPRTVLEAIFYVLRTGIQWKAIPKTFGAASSIHRYFRFWCEQGFFQALWIAGLEHYEEGRGIDWTWLSGDGCMSKAPLAQEGVGKNPSDRGKKRKQTASSGGRGGGTSGAGGNRSQPPRRIPT